MLMNIILWILYTVDYLLDKSKILIIFTNPPLDDDNKLTVKEGETIGPFSCTSDCNPACDTRWKLKTLGGLSDPLSEDGMLLPLVAKRNMKMLRCIAEWRYNNETITEDNALNIQCKYFNLCFQYSSCLWILFLFE